MIGERNPEIAAMALRSVEGKPQQQGLFGRTSAGHVSFRPGGVLVEAHVAGVARRTTREHRWRTT